MTRLFLVGILNVLSYTSMASSVKASSFGWTGIDDTQALYDAFTTEVDTVYVDLQEGDWVSGPLIFDNSVNDRVIIFERGVTLRALAGAYDAYLYDGLLNFINCSGVSLIGYDAKLVMNKQEYIDLNDGSEWRHVISLSGCNHFDIFGLELLDSGGDGIEISGIWQQAIPSTNIHVKNCRIDNNYRQGISITSASKVIIEHCEITNTSGTPPAYGIDLEPDTAYNQMSEITIRNCRITDNEGGGILVALWKLDQSSIPVGIDVYDCYIGSNQNVGVAIDVNSSGPVPGYAKFERCVIENQPSNGIFSNKRESLKLIFSDMVIRNVGTDNVNNDPAYNMPIAIQKQYDYSGLALGNISFENVFIDDRNHNRDFLTIDHWGGSTQVENVTGNFTIYNPNGISYHIEPPLHNVTIDTASIDGLPMAEVSLGQIDDTAYEEGLDTTATFGISRNATDFSFPLDIAITASGTATPRLDYDYFPGIVVIPANENTTSYTVVALKDSLEEVSENINMAVTPADHYTTSGGNTQLFILDMILLPVRLVQFDVFLTQQQDKILLKWTTASETNNKGFEVQKQNHNAQWETIAWVEAKNDLSNLKHYQYTDNKPHQGINYYRLKQIDHDGSSEYSKVVGLDFSHETALICFPNPAQERLFIRNPSRTKLRYAIYNISGQVVADGFLDKEDGIDISSLQAGSYTLKLQRKDKATHILSFVKN